MFSTAITRKPGKNFSKGITTAEFRRAQLSTHASTTHAYIETLKEFGLRVIELEPLPITQMPTLWRMLL